MNVPQRVVKRYVSPLLWEFDTVTIRMILATASACFATALLSSGQPFSREAYSIMEAVGHEVFWALAFLLHTIGTYWRLAEAKSRPKWALCINAYGAFIWSFATVSITVALGYLVPTLALAYVVVPLAFWALIRTAAQPERFTP